MRFFAALVLPLAVRGSVLKADLTRRSEPSGQPSVSKPMNHSGGDMVMIPGVDGIMNMHPETLGIEFPKKIVDMPPQVRKDAKRQRLYYGPYTLPGVNDPKPRNAIQMDPNSSIIDTWLFGMCNNCTVIQSRADVLNPDDTRAEISNQIYQHHIVIIDMLKQRKIPFYLCPGETQTDLGKIPASGFMVAGNDPAENWFTSPDGEFQSGYDIGLAGAFLMSAEIVNYDTKKRDVYIITEIEFIPGQPANYNDTAITVISVTGCGAPAYHPPPGQLQYNLTSDKMVMPIDGYIVNAKGHMHDGGVSLVLKLNEKEVCESTAEYGGPEGTSEDEDGRIWETIAKMTQCSEPISVKKGDVLTLTSVYDTGLHPLRQGVDGTMMDEMGVMFLNFGASPDVVGGGIDIQGIITDQMTDIATTAIQNAAGEVIRYAATEMIKQAAGTYFQNVALPAIQNATGEAIKGASGELLKNFGTWMFQTVASQAMMSWAGSAIQFASQQASQQAATQIVQQAAQQAVEQIGKDAGNQAIENAATQAIQGAAGQAIQGAATMVVQSIVQEMFMATIVKNLPGALNDMTQVVQQIGHSI